MGDERRLLLVYARVIQIFQTIYGVDLPERYIRRLVEILEAFSPPPTRPPEELRAGDSLLITYGDAIQSGDMSPLRTLHRFMATKVGSAISTLHLLPFFPYSSDDGFSVIDYTRVDPALGGWEDIAALREDYDLVFDAVINHISVKSAWFQGFLKGDRPFSNYFITVDPEVDLKDVFRPRALPLLTQFDTRSGPAYVWTTFSKDQVDLNYHNPEVLLEIVRILLMFVARGARFIRLDAIAYIWKEIGTSCIHLEKTHRIIQLFRAIFDAVAPYVQIITETNVPHAENISYFGDGTNEAQMVYNFSLPPLLLHAFHHQSAARLSQWAKTLKLPSSQTHFFNFTASHDGIGVTPAQGLIPDAEIQAMCEQVEALGGYVSYKANPDGSRSPYELNINYLDALGDPAFPAEPDALIADRFLASQAIMLALKGVPGIYYHSLLGSRSWREGVQQTGRKRTINREKLDYQTLVNEIGRGTTLRAMVFRGYLALLEARGAGAPEAFDPAADQRILDGDDRLFGLVREARGGGQQVLCLTNVSREKVALDGVGDIAGGPWELLLARGAEFSITKRGLRAELAPYGVLWLVSR